MSASDALAGTNYKSWVLSYDDDSMGMHKARAVKLRSLLIGFKRHHREPSGPLTGL